MTKSSDLNKGQKPRPAKSPVKFNVVRSDPSKQNNAQSAPGSGTRTSPQTQTGIQSPNRSVPITAPKDTKIPTEAQVQRLIKSDISSDYKLISQPPFSDLNLVTDNIYLTGMFGITKEKFERFHIISKSIAAKNKMKPSLIVNATKELPNLVDFDCLRVFVSCSRKNYSILINSFLFQIEDDRSEDIYPHLQVAVDRMYQTVCQDGKVVVHCVAGVSRSSAIVMAYLIRHRKMTLRRAYTSVVRARQVSRPNSTFIVQLMKFEQNTMGTKSAKLIRVKKNGITVELPDFLFFDLPNKFEEEFNSNRIMNRVPDCGNEHLSNEYPLYDLDKGESIPVPGSQTTNASQGLRVKSNESLGANTNNSSKTDH